MDDREKKLLVQLDDPMPGQRANALELLHAHDVQNKSSFRDRVPKIERGEQYDALEQDVAALRQQNAALDAELTQYKAAVGTWQSAYAAQAAKLAVASAVAWGRTTGKRLAAYVAVPVIALGLWQGYERYWPVPADVDTGFRQMAARSPWGSGCGHAVVRDAGGSLYWVLLCGRTDTTSDMNSEGQPIGLHCLDLYAVKATADWQNYAKVDPYGLFGWWIKWPKLAVHCHSFEIKEAQK
jgi:hypothetical protein